jgi:uroporphyrinogen-III synthase
VVCPHFLTDIRCGLEAKGVLVTRPAGQAAELCRLIAEAGGRPIPFPTVEIESTEPTASRTLLDQRWDLIVFVSRNAVERALPLFPGGRLPAEPDLAAVGAATARALTSAGRPPDLVPTGRFDSDALLSSPGLADMRGKQVLIVRGVGGRPLLGDTLAARGARIAYAEVYRRVLPSADASALVAGWSREVHLVTATSGEILDNLLALIGAPHLPLVLATPLVVVSERTARAARKLGFALVEVAERADDEAVLAALCRAVEAAGDRSGAAGSPRG